MFEQYKVYVMAAVVAASVLAGWHGRVIYDGYKHDAAAKLSDEKVVEVEKAANKETGDADKKIEDIKGRVDALKDKYASRPAPVGPRCVLSDGTKRMLADAYRAAGDGAAGAHREPASAP